MHQYLDSIYWEKTSLTSLTFLKTYGSRISGRGVWAGGGGGADPPKARDVNKKLW